MKILIAGLPELLKTIESQKLIALAGYGLRFHGHWSSFEIDVEDTASTLMNFSVDDKPVAVHLHQDAGFDRNQLFLDQTRHFLACMAGRESALATEF